MNPYTEKVNNKLHSINLKYVNAVCNLKFKKAARLKEKAVKIYKHLVFISNG